MSQRIKKAKRRYTIEMFAAMALYVAVVFASVSFAKGNDIDSVPLLIALSLAPVAPIILATIVFFRFYTSMDEMQKRLSANAAAITLVIGVLTALTLGFLQRFGVFSIEDDMIWFGPFLIVCWSAVRFFIGGREC